MITRPRFKTVGLAGRRTMMTPGALSVLRLSSMVIVSRPLFWPEASSVTRDTGPDSNPVGISGPLGAVNSWRAAYLAR